MHTTHRTDVSTAAQHSPRRLRTTFAAQTAVMRLSAILTLILMAACGVMCQGDSVMCQDGSVMGQDSIRCQDSPSLSDVVVAHQQAELQEAFQIYNPTTFYNVLPHSDSAVRLVFYDAYTSFVVNDKAYDVDFIPEGLVDYSGIPPGNITQAPLDGERAPADNGNLTLQDMLSMAKAARNDSRS